MKGGKKTEWMVGGEGRGDEWVSERGGERENSGSQGWWEWREGSKAGKKTRSSIKGTAALISLFLGSQYKQRDDIAGGRRCKGRLDGTGAHEGVQPGWNCLQKTSEWDGVERKRVIAYAEWICSEEMQHWWKNQIENKCCRGGRKLGLKGGEVVWVSADDEGEWVDEEWKEEERKGGEGVDAEWKEEEEGGGRMVRNWRMWRMTVEYEHSCIDLLEKWKDVEEDENMEDIKVMELNGILEEGRMEYKRYQREKKI